jgi:Tfp pilus assembly ATPase PilU
LAHDESLILRGILSFLSKTPIVFLGGFPRDGQLPGTIQVSQKDGMQTMDMALQNLVGRGLVTKEEAQAKSMNPNLFGSTTLGTAAGAR